jgi:hypothetical protein
MLARVGTIGLAVAALALGVAMEARAALTPYTFTFDDEYLVKNGAAFSTVFPGATGNAPGTGNSGKIYQKTQTTPSIIITALTTGLTSSIPGEYVQNSSLGEGLYLNGWGQSLNYGQQVGSVYNLNNPTNGPIYFQYKIGATSGFLTGGTATAFTFNSFDLRGANANANLAFTLEAFDSSNHLIDSDVLTVTGNTFHTFTENWQSVFAVEIVSTSTVPVNWGSGTLYMDNIVLNNAVPAAATPEPATIVVWSLLGASWAGVSVMRRRRRSGVRSAWSPETRAAIHSLIERGRK